MDMVSGVGVLDKAMAVLRSVGEAPRNLVELQRATGIPRASAHGLLRRDADGRFELGLALVALGDAAATRAPIVDRARHVLEILRAETGESVQLFVREGDQRRCILSYESTHALRWIVPQGALLPLAVGSAGRVLGGETGRTGWIQSVEEREPGVASVSAPVLAADGTVSAAVSVSGPIERTSRQPGRRFGDRVVAAARQLSSTT
jgi:DNA-binding IclR family transcriptional regulator